MGSVSLWEMGIRNAIHSNLRPPYSAEIPSPPLSLFLSFSQWGQQRKQSGDWRVEADCLLLSSTFQNQGYIWNPAQLPTCFYMGIKEILCLSPKF